MTFKPARLAFIFSTLTLVSCGGGSGSNNSTEEPTGTVPTTTNAAPVCTSSVMSLSRGSGTQSLLSALSCTDSDNDTLSYANYEVTTSGVSTGNHQQNVSVSDGQGNQITVLVEYRITNQAPQCEQTQEPSFVVGTEQFSVTQYLTCDDQNNDSVTTSPQIIETSQRGVGVYSVDLTSTDGELAISHAFKFSIINPSANNASPECSASNSVFSRGSGVQSLESSLNCTDADGDALSYSNVNVNTEGVTTGSYNQDVTVSDSQGHDIIVVAPYDITNQAPSCQQSTTPDFTKGSGLVDLSGHINCDDPNKDALSYSNNTINPDDLSVGEQSHSVTVSDGELATIFAVSFTVSEVTAELTRCEQITQSVSFSGESDVTVTCDQEFAYITSDTYPKHDLMNGITGTNEQVPVPAVNYAAPIKLNPVYVNGTTTIDAAVGVAVNGVPIYDYSAQGELDVHNYDPSTDTLLLGQLDNCGGHSGRGDDYHYHAAPTCMIDAMTLQGDDVIIGWGYDGYPLYGDNNPDGSVIANGELDVCNSQEDGVYGRRYHTSQQPPYIIQCLVGEVDTQNLPRVSPLQAQQEDHRANLKPPQEGVENLTFVEDPDGTRTMRYDYQGESYYTIYSPVNGQNNCYQFEMKTITGNGQVNQGTYCR